MKVLSFETEDEWLQARRQYITATMIARLASSRSEWQRVWDEREHGSTFHGNRYTDWGKQREPEIAKWVANGDDKSNGIDSRLVPTYDLYVDDDGISAASPDMVSVPWSDERIGAEIKTVTAERAWVVPKGTKPEDIKNFVPQRYYDQVQWNIKVYEAEWWFLIWEVHYGFDEKTVERHWCVIYPDRERIKELESIRDEFLAGDWRDEDARPDVSRILRRLHEVRLMKRPLDEEEQELLDELRECLGDEDTAFEDAGFKVSWTLPKPRKTWQKKAFEQAHPDLVAEFTTEVPAKTRTLRVTEVKTDA